MQDFNLWFQTGLEHILDLEGYDHICYIFALAISYRIMQWKPLFIQITAFTIGHSLSLAASTLELVKIPQPIIELVIPLTIVITCLANIYNSFKNDNSISVTLNYSMALSFGLIHGLGFSYLLKSMLGKSGSIIFPLFSFNIGLEMGQILIVAFVFLLTYIVEKSNIFSHKYWTRAISITIGLIALNLLQDRI
jgi:hypothetical protein